MTRWFKINHKPITDTTTIPNIAASIGAVAKNISFLFISQSNLLRNNNQCL
jgi:hypothetical protein